ncbi:MAG: sugar ABC transporter permease [Polyangiaceae bacterium]|jgi:sn-glycerol 3-phosphate transport system permease protein
MNPRTRWHPWLLLAPTLVLLFVFFVVPIGVAAVESFFVWDLLTAPRFVGLGNYRSLMARGELAGILIRTTGYSMLVVAGTMSLGLALAVLLHRPGKVFAFVRASVFSAYVVSWVAVALLWMWMLDGNSGIAGQVLRGLGAPPLALLGDRRTALPALAAIGVWKLTGYAMVVFLSGLEGVPPSLLEAAALDGAGPFARFRHVTLPLLGPTAAFVATTSLATSFQAFDVVRIITQGGPARATELLVYAIYEEIFMNLRVGRASALTVVFFAMLVVIGVGSLGVRRARAAST